MHDHMVTIFTSFLIQRGLKVRQPATDTSDDDSGMESLDQPTDFSGLPIQVNWNTELPANISVPPVNMHSLVLDFSAVSFLDISALKGLKTVSKMAYYEIQHTVNFHSLRWSEIPHLLQTVLLFFL